MFTHDIYPSKTGRSVLTLASELSELAAEMAKDKGITPKDARLALELASRVSANTKETPNELIKRMADAMKKVSEAAKDPKVESALEDLRIVANAMIEEM
ncbi:hypothetical protein MX007_002670 [Salmonella enterica]|uniref:hypothetical protein n=1 Tax=Escherichia coli TaxID=562 RepID=UPI000CFCD73B|nr:hypothetical protein [Escherichia coli]EEK2382802.1 hypothetical protein [Salmonella enterica subsp. enterica serovar Typhimurium]EEP9290034.1 hypothetical protein [Salmonella enterica]EGX8325146.1 hypothetical protein [Salmonella enterica subsp. enterica serovar Javiana]EJA5032653.1 hypothetical protein [Salmonella enterica]EJC0357358.1 hypothetical protein [Salmonella enterica]